MFVLFSSVLILNCRGRGGSLEAGRLIPDDSFGDLVKRAAGNNRHILIVGMDANSYDPAKDEQLPFTRLIEAWRRTREPFFFFSEIYEDRYVKSRLLRGTQQVCTHFRILASKTLDSRPPKLHIESNLLLMEGAP